MSLINQMLKDLESRQTPELPTGAVPAGSQTTGQGRKPGPLVLILVILVALLCAGLAYILWQQQERPGLPITEAAPPVSAPVSATVQPAPKPAPQAEAVVKKRVAVQPAPAPSSATQVPVLVDKGAAKKAPEVKSLSQLGSITPSVVDGSMQRQAFTLKGKSLESNQRVVVNWDNGEKILATDRVEWLDSTTARIKLVTGNSGGVWQVALLRPDGTRSKAVEFEVIATVADDPDNTVSGTSGRIEKVIRPPSKAEQADRLYQQGYRALQKKQADKAEQLWLQALDTLPVHIKSREGMVALLLSQGRKIEAQKLLQEGVKHHPENAHFSMLYARLLAEQGETAAALMELEETMGRAVSNPDLFALAAALYQQQRNYNKSIAVYQQALQMQPQQAHWWMGLAISLEGAAKPDEAAAAYQEALRRGGLGQQSQRYVEQRLSALK